MKYDAILIGSQVHFAGISSDHDIDLICRPGVDQKLYKHFQPHVKIKYVRDTHTTISDRLNGYIFDIENAWSGSSAEALFNLNTIKPHQELSDITGLNVGVISIHLNLSLPWTHWFKDSVHFEKTRNKCNHSLKFTIAPTYEERVWLELRRMETESTIKTPSLMRNKNEFFSDDGVNYKYDHDWLHEVFAIDEEPAYKSFQQENHEVFSSAAKFHSLPKVVKMNAVIEEATVLSFERSIVKLLDSGKMPSTESMRITFKTALQKMSTSLTSGWFRDYCWFQYDEAKAYMDEQYAKRVLEKFIKSTTQS